MTGAGDTVLSVLALAVAAHVPIREAAVLANAGAGVVVGKLGTSTVTPGELFAAVRESWIRSLVETWSGIARNAGTNFGIRAKRGTLCSCSIRTERFLASRRNDKGVTTVLADYK